ncbi:MAG TPA: hypothetical protein VFD59_09935 [Nocardioidaceae bacterium]|nr:hypothetical protein [Nocardioidaceae bacterium]
MLDARSRAGAVAALLVAVLVAALTPVAVAQTTPTIPVARIAGANRIESAIELRARADRCV